MIRNQVGRLLPKFSINKTIAALCLSLALIGCKNPFKQNSDGGSIALGLKSGGSFIVTPSGTNVGVLPSNPQTVSSGTVLNFTVTANTGYTTSQTVGGTCPLGTWSGLIYTPGTISADCTVTFSGAVKTLTVTPSLDGHTSTTPSGAQTVNHGNTQAFVVTPSTDYTTSSTVGGSCAAGSWSSSTYTTGVVTTDCSVSFSSTLNTWSGIKQVGVATKTTYGLGGAVDSSGNVYAAGMTNGGLNGNTLTGSWDCFVSRHSSAGSLTWLKQIGSASNECDGNAIAVDSSDNVYMAGFTLGGLNGNTQTGTFDYFVAKYDNAGSLTWLTQLGKASSASYGQGVAVDSSGNVYVAGYTTGGLNGNTQVGIRAYFVSKYNSSGSLIWLKQLGVSAKNTYGFAVAVDSSGNVYASGSTSGGLNGNSQTGSYDYFVVKYDSSGNLTWLKQLGLAAIPTESYGVSVDSSGNVYAVGYTSGGLNGNTLTGSKDYFVAKHDSSGNLTWLKQLGVSGLRSYTTAVTVDSSGNVYASGYTTGGLNGNTQTGGYDYFAVKYNSSGTLTWLKQAGKSAKDAFGQGVAVDSSGNVFVAGKTSGGLGGNTAIGSYDLFISKYNASGTLQ